MIPEALKPYMGWDDGDAHPTGSRYICNPPVLDTDEDYIVRANGIEFVVGKLLRQGFTETGQDDEYPDEGVFMTMRKGQLNLIITGDEQFFGRFVAATELSRKLNLRNKPARIALFQAVLYGNSDGLTGALEQAA